MQTYREIRSITGQKMWVRENAYQRRERILFRVEVALMPIAVILIWAAAAGVI